jgi:hypothetical protein
MSIHNYVCDVHKKYHEAHTVEHKIRKANGINVIDSFNNMNQLNFVNW